MDTAEARSWFAAYFAEFVALCRGDHDDVRRILDHYGVPMMVSTRAGTRFLTDEEQVLAVAHQQVDAMRAAGYDRSDEQLAETTLLNASCAVHRGRFARLRADGSEISVADVTYLITDGPAGCRISALIVH
jgi:hypothetical protein